MAQRSRWMTCRQSPEPAIPAPPPIRVNGVHGLSNHPKRVMWAEHRLAWISPGVGTRAFREERRESGSGRAVKSNAHVPRLRRVVVALLVIFGCVLAPLAALSIWLKAELLNTDAYVSTMAPLADDPDVQNALADRITHALVVDTSLEQEVAGRLPDRAEFLAPKLTDAFASVVHDAALKIVQSEQFSELWERANRRAHTQVVALLEGKSSGRLGLDDGEITLDLGPIAAKVRSALEARGIDVFENTGSRGDQRVVLVKSVWLERSQNATDLLQKLAVVLPLLTILCFGVAIALSPNRRRTVLRAALGFALGMAIVAIAFNAGRHFYLDVLPSSVNQAAAGSVYDQLVADLRLALRTGFALGLVVALGAWLAGPARPATKLRDSVLGLAHGTQAGDAPRPLPAFVARHRIGLRVLIIGAGVVVLVALSTPSPAAVLVIALLVLVGVVIVELLARGARPAQEAPGPTIDDDHDERAGSVEPELAEKT